MISIKLYIMLLTSSKPDGGALMKAIVRRDTNVMPGEPVKSMTVQVRLKK